MPAIPADFRAADRVIENALPRLGGGAVLAVVNAKGVVYMRAYGMLKAESAQPVASASKWLSSAAVLAAVDAGKISLDDKASKFVPSLKGPKAEITIRQLLSHTSGLPPEASCLDRARMTLAECADEIAQSALRAKPGTVFAYGGASMQVAARAVEVAAGKPWVEWFREKVVTPLGLEHTAFGSFRQRNPRVAGGLFTTAADYARFLEMVLNKGMFRGKRVLSERVVEEWFKDQTGGARYVNSPLPGARYSLGAWIEPGGVVSSPGLLGSCPWADRKKGAGAVLIVLGKMREAMPVWRDLRKVL